MVQKQNIEWYEKRASGKVERRLETDTIQKFIEYAKDQGSQSAEKYYMVLTKMENNTLFNLALVEQKIPNLREIVEGFALDSLKMADYMVGKALKEGMSKNMNYKDIYQLAKGKVELFAGALGKVPLQMILKDGAQKMIRTDAKFGIM